MTPLHVVAGVLRDERGRVLLAERPAGKQLAGLWEFPGGKLEEGEVPVDALARELREELGIVVESARPLIAIPHDGAQRAIRLDIWDVSAWSGEFASHDGQRLAWVEPDALGDMPMPPADRLALGAVRLPDRMLVTPDLPPDAVVDLLCGIEDALVRGVRLVQLRLPQWSSAAFVRAAREVRDLCTMYAAGVVLNGDPRLAVVLGLDGVHLAASAAARIGAGARPVPDDRWFGVSCHDEAELAHAVALGADYATLSPVYATASHPAAEPLGWDRFAELVAPLPIPVYAQGGLAVEDIDEARMAGAQGVAAIRGLWPA